MDRLSVLFLVGCVVSAPDAQDTGAKDSSTETNECPDILSKDEFIDPWREAFCSWNVACGILAYGDSMEHCYELTTGIEDRCIDLCKTKAVLDIAQAAAADPDCEAGSVEGIAVPYCEE